MLKWIRQNKTVIIVLFVLGMLVYLTTFQNELFWDDEDFITNNQYVQNFDVGSFFSENLIAGAGFVSNYWRPALLTAFSLQYQVWGDWPAGYHITSALFHILSGILLFYLFRVLTKNKWMAFFAAAFFIVHPLQTEAVSYASSFGDSLSVFFILSGLILYHNWLVRRKSFLSVSYAGVGILYILALLSKETAVIMPGLISLVDFFHPQHSGAFRDRLVRTIKNTGVFYLLGFLYVGLRASVLNFQNTFNLYNEQNVFTSSFTTRIYTFFRILVIYLSLLLVPAGLHMERSVQIAESLLQGDVLLGGGVFAVMIFLILYCWRLNKWVSFGLLWFLFALVPTSNIFVPINGLLYEHWLYLPMAGFFLAVVSGIFRTARKYGLVKLAAVFLAVVLIPLTAQAVMRNTIWETPFSLYEDTLKYSPDSYRVVNNLGKAYAERGVQDEAVKYYTRAILTDSEVPVAYHNLANTYKELGDFELAEENYLLALEKDAEFTFSRNALLSMYLENRQTEQAVNLLEKQLKIADNKQKKLQVLNLIVNIQLGAGNKESAFENLGKVLELDPNNRQARELYVQLKIDLNRE